MTYEVRQLTSAEFPPLLAEINDPPKELFGAGNLALLQDDLKFLAIVGSRKYTPYGKQVCERLISGLRGSSVCVVSGLALGTDAIAHRAALLAGIPTIAVPGSGLDPSVLYPRTNLKLAYDIVNSDGALLSEFEPTFKATPWSFPQRNRIMAGMTHATLVIEAAEKSGTLITSKLATEYNRDVLTVPGSILSANSVGPHMLIKLGATPVTSSDDILEALNTQTEPAAVHVQLTELEQNVLSQLNEPQNKNDVIRSLNIPTHEAQIVLTKMELKGLLIDRLGTLHKK